MNSLCARFLFISALLFVCSASTQQSLPSKPVLQVLAITPATSSPDTGPVTIQGTTAITVIFNRAVIPLGADFGDKPLPNNYVPFTLSANVSGSWRWVTTSIAVFYPAGTWMSDLSFNLNINPSLTSFDGLRVEAFKTVSFITPSLAFSYADVSSALASLLTDGQWSATLPHTFVDGTSANSPEVPFDAFMLLNFNNEIEQQLISRQLRVQALSGGQNPQIIYNNCSSCSKLLNLSFSGLQRGAKYSIVLDAGASYHSRAGPLRQAISYEFYGPFEFSFSFKQFDQYTHPNSFRYRLFLRHGLSNTTDLAALKANIAFNPPVSFVLTRPNNYSIQLEGAFQTSSLYTISITGSDQIKDGFGFPLLSNSARFQTAPLAEFYVRASSDYNSVILFDSSFDSDWVYVVSNTSSCQSHNLFSKTISSANEVASFVSSSTSSIPNMNTNSLCTSGHTANISKAIFGTTNAFGIRHNTSGYYDVERYVVARTQYAASVVYSNYKQLIVWVTKNEAAENVEGATVTAVSSYGTTYTGTTDSKGMAIINAAFGGTGVSFSVVIEKNGQITPVPRQFYYAYMLDTSVVRGVVVTDRVLYRPGETVFVKAYLKGDVGNNAVSLSLSYQSSTLQQKSQNVSMTSNGAFNSFSAQMVIPTDIFYRQYSLQLNVGSKGIATAPIKVSDPRVPTIFITTNTSSRVYTLGSPFVLNADIEYYLGTPLANYPVTMTWKLTRGSFSTAFSNYKMNDYYGSLPSCGSGLDWVSTILKTNSAPLPTNGTSGTITLQTDEQGRISYPFTLPSVANNGDQVSFDFEVFGPTGEQLKDSKTVTVAPSEWSLSVCPTNTAPVPGYSTSFKVSLSDVDGNMISGVPIRGSIYKWDKQPFNYSNIANYPKVFDCQLSSDVQIPTCNYKVTEMGNFIAVFIANDTRGGLVISAFPFGKSQAEWQAKPLSSLDGISIDLEKSEYAVGDTVRFTFLNPFNVAQMVVMWGQSEKSMNQAQFSVQGANTTSTYQVVLGSECKGATTCTFVFLLHSPRQPNKMSLPVPTSILFDLSAPASYSTQKSISIISTDSSLRVDIKTPPTAFPGQQITVNLQLSDSKGQAADGEICVFVVDQSIIDLAPPAAADFNNSLINQYASWYLQTEQTNQYLSSSRAYLSSLQVILDRVNSDPYITPSWNIAPSSSNDIDTPIKDFLNNYFYFLTTAGYVRPFYYPEAMMNPGAPVMSVGAAISDSSTNSLSSLPTLDLSSGIRTSFAVTPFWTPAVTTQNGKASVTFTLPDNLGKFSIRAFAVNSAGYGQTTTSFTSQNLVLNLLPVNPRLVRYGDTFLSGVTLSLTDSSYTGPITVKVEMVCDAVHLLATSSSQNPKQVVNVSPGSRSPQALFLFSAYRYGQATLIFSAYDQGGALVDAVEVQFPVKGVQEPVYVGTSMAINPANLDDPVLTEGLQVPPSVPGTGTLVLEAGVGRLPTVTMLSSQLMNLLTTNYKPSGMDLLGSLMPKFALAAYPTNSVPDPALITTADQRYYQALNMLSAYTDSRLGLVWFPPEPMYYSLYQPDPYLNAYGLIVNWFLKDLGSGIPDALTSTWKVALSNGIRNMRYIDINTYALAYLADPNGNSNLLSALMTNSSQLSNFGRTCFALSLTLQNIQAAQASSLIQMVINDIRIQGRVAYVAYGPYNANADMATTALFLRLLVMVKNPLPSLEKMANFLSQGGRNGTTIDSFSLFYETRQAFLTLYSLVKYDVSTSSTNPNLSFDVKSGSSSLLSARFDSSNTYAKSTASFDSLSDYVKFTAQGQGEVSIALGMDFVPAQLFNVSLNRGIQVSKVIQAVDPVTQLPMGPPLTQGQPGTNVLVTITITTTDQITMLSVVDPLPAALEATDQETYTPSPCFSNTYGVSSSSSSLSSRWLPCFSFWWFPVFQKEVLSDQVRFFARNLYAGTHTMSYYALVNTQGLFVLPPTKAYDVANPEYMGISAASRFNSSSPILAVTLRAADLHPVLCTSNLTAAPTTARPTLPFTTSPPLSSASVISVSSYLIFAVILVTLLAHVHLL